ncbi:MAG: cardiolipin synthase [Bacteroidaceae bacterium]|nr:cardiolipin synthase [Bacteroidaceae bacterium]
MKFFGKNMVLLAVVLLLSSCSSFVAIERGKIDDSAIAFKEYLQTENIEITDSNTVRMLNGAHAKFDDMLAAISEAKHHVHLEYFNFRNDSINSVLLGLLAKKAAEGVEVRALFDAFGNMSNNRPLKRSHIKEIRAAGIELVKFDPIVFPWVNHSVSRDHRKIVIIDGKTAYIGGINVADYYLTGLEGIGKWRDIHARVDGAAVAPLQDIFLEMWNRETGQQIGGAAYYPRPSATGTAEVAVVDRWPRRTPKSIRRAYANAVNSAKDSVVLVSPYFIPMPIVKKAIKKAIDDGVKVDIMLTAKGDIPLLPDGVWRIGYQLMKRGANVYMYDGGFNHSKVMCVDGKYMTVGSANLNSRSMRYDYETNIFVFDKEDTRELQNIIDEDKKESFLLTKEIYKKRSLWKRFCGFFVVLFTPIM